MDILLVDDDDLFLTVLVRALEPRGHDVRTARDGQQALTEIADRAPELVISDVEMPGLNGVDMTRQLRVSHPNLPVILMTAVGGAAKASTAFEVGAYGYLVKPMRLASLLAGIQRLESHDPPDQTDCNLNHLSRGADR